MEHTDGCDERLAAEGEVAVARLAMDSGDLPHAADHLADAMTTDPQLPELHEALAELWARAGGAEAARELFPLDGQVYLGTVVCRAHVEAAAGDWDAAVALLASAIQYEPGKPWAHTAWLGREDLPELVSPDAVAQAVMRAAGTLPDPLPEELRPAVQPFEDFAQAVVARHPDHPLLLAVVSGLTRRLGATARAVELAEHAHRLAPEYLPAVMLGNALRAHGEPDRALEVWEAELARDPSDTYLAVDIAELYGATGRPAEGLPWLDRVLATEPDHPKAGPALHGLRHAVDGGTAHLVALVDHYRAHPEHDYAPDLLARLCRRQPWLGMVPGATEATVNVLHQVLKSSDTGRDNEITCTVSALEPPSSLLALHLALPRATVEYRAVLDPDPRLPLCEVGTRVWTYDGTDPRPAVAPPSASGAELVRGTAEIVWPSLPAAYDHAVRLAALPLDDLVGVLAHPPAPREEELGQALLAHQPELWVRAVQSFACLGIAHHRTDQPWEGSDRRRVLLDLLLGSEDWVVEAAGFALTAIGWTHPEVRADIAAQLRTRLRYSAEASQRREVTVLRSVCTLVLACPWLDEADLDLARRLIERDDLARAAEPTEEDEHREREAIEQAKAPAPAEAEDPEATGGRAAQGAEEAEEALEAEKATEAEEAAEPKPVAPRPGLLRRLLGRG
ncbi:tetratricopeptide repeat protein [Kitasatospora sp. NPDC087315]|uniref:tetratricopeptide repeat protein n=1 Tax=Kitasatospora sp. NPDC087315 TaxID=3364069 RepID=UPI0037FE6C00